jgi:hypothetical protein
MLSNLSGLNYLNYVGEDLEVRYCPNLTSLEGVDSLEVIKRELIISHSDSLTDLTGIENLDTLGGLSLYFNKALTSIGELELSFNAISTLYVLGNDNLHDFSGLEGINEITSHCFVEDNPQIVDFSGLDSVTYIRDLWVKDNPSLISFEGLENLSSIKYSIVIWNNDSLFNLTGLENLSSAEIGILIRDNDTLNSIEQLSNLSTCENLTINNNPNLSSLAGIDNIDAATIGTLYIMDNARLSLCHVQSICDYLVSPNGTVSIYNNAPGCNSVEEVEDSCGIVTIAENQLMDRMSVFPNPFTTSTTIEYELYTLSTIHITVYNILGEMVYEEPEQVISPGIHKVVISLGYLPEGLYYTVLRSEDGVSVVKMIKE